MSKKVTQKVHGELRAARQAKADRKRETKQSETGGEQTPEQDRQEAAVATKRSRDGMPARRAQTTTEAVTPEAPGDDGDALCVFAIRLKRSERDELHAAAGSAKASRFVRAIILAGARGDMKAVQEAVDSIHAAR